MKAKVKELLTPPAADMGRRSFFRTLGMTAGAAAVMSPTQAAEAAANFVQNAVKRASEPSKLQITDLRVAVVEKAPVVVEKSKEEASVQEEERPFFGLPDDPGVKEGAAVKRDGTSGFRLF